MKKPDIPLPNKLLNFFSAKLPDIWKNVDYYRFSENAGEVDWEAGIFMPNSAWWTLLSEKYPGIGQENQSAILANMIALGAWRPTQDILRFDPDFYKTLTGTPVTGDLPVAILERLPAWGIYFETQNLVVNGLAADGFFACLDQSDDRRQIILRLQFAAEDNLKVFPFLLPIGEWSIEEAVARTNAQQENAMKRLGREMTGEYTRIADEGLHAAMNLLLYVCAYGINDRQEFGHCSGMRYPAPTKTKKGGWRLFPPPKPVIRNIGEEMGSEIREAQKRISALRAHGSPRPHIRRPHWHGYWKGPIKNTREKRKFELRWLPPIKIGSLPEDD